MVVGGGWIGLEVAAAARTYGNQVTVVEPLPTPLHAVLGPRWARCSPGCTASTASTPHRVTVTRVPRLRPVVRRPLEGGAELPADLVVVGVGAVPNIELAEAAGLDVDHGVVTDAALRTSAPDVYAAGDIASAFHPLYGRHVRVEHWANALNQGPAAARSMLGQDVGYDRVPYFFTDQYDLGMEYSGLGCPGRDRGLPRRRRAAASSSRSGSGRAG